MLEIKCIGRAGQGAVTFSQILAIGAFYDKKYCQAMPAFGVERRGAPSFSYTRINDKPVNIRSLITHPDIIVLLDASLIESIDVAEGLKKDGIIIVNSSKKPEELGLGNFKIFTVDASSTALNIFKADIVNTAMLGAFAAVTKQVSLKGINHGLNERFKRKDILKKNQEAVKEVYDNLK